VYVKARVTPYVTDSDYVLCKAPVSLYIPMYVCMCVQLDTCALRWLIDEFSGCGQCLIRMSEEVEIGKITFQDATRERGK